MNRWSRFAWLPALVCLMSCTGNAADFPAPGDESSNYQQDILLDGLDNPSGLAARVPAGEGQKQEVFFAESGAGRVCRFVAGESAEAETIIEGFTVRPISEEPALRFGPYALAFLTPKKLIVAGGVEPAAKTGQAARPVGVYLLSDDETSLSAQNPEYEVGSLIEGQTEEAQGLGFVAAVIDETTAYFAAGQGIDAGRILDAKITANQLEDLQTFFAVDGGRNLRWPSALCMNVSERARYLVAGFLGTLGEERDSQLVFCVPSSGHVALQLPTGLMDLVGVAYGPSGLLYAIDFAASDSSQGGVYRIDDARWNGRPACRTVKIAVIDHPTSLMFAADGSLLVAACGSPLGNMKGKIVRITGKF